MKKSCNIYFILLLLSFVTILTISCAIKDLPRPAGEYKKASFIAKYYKDKELDFIEGVWRWQNGFYEIAIIRNTFDIYSEYDYLGIITDVALRGWKIGEPKLLINATSSGDIYAVDYHLHSRSKPIYKTILTLKNDDIAVIKLPYGWDIKERPVLIRSYPKNNKISKAIDKSELDKKISKIPSKYNDFLNGVVVVRSSDSIGTGFLISQNGYIITNKHVVRRDSSVSIKLRNGKTLMGNVISRGKNVDLALIQIDGENYTWLSLGELSDAGIGSDILAVGTPEGLDWSVSRGIVSALRNINNVAIIQTDAAINKGNSGGPLISLENGKVIGVNSFGYRKDIAEGLNFAISVDEIKKSFPEIYK